MVVLDEVREGLIAHQRLDVCETCQAGWRLVSVTEQRTKQDYARCIHGWWTKLPLTPNISGSCKTTRVTHTPAALYETFAPAKARRILRRLEFHFTPNTAVG